MSDAPHSAPEPLSPTQRRARLALILLCLLAPAIYLPRVLLGRQTPMPEEAPAAWTHLVVVTVGAWTELGPSLADDTITAFDRRASRVGAAFAPSPSSAGAAASLWTGRYPRAHGVRTNALALPSGTWTIARGARSAGTRTAAFLQEPFVSATAIHGFDEVVEDFAAGGAALAARAADFLERADDDRVLVWLHLADAGPRGAEVAAALGGIERALSETDRTPESAVALVLLAREPWSSAPEEARGADGLAGPLWVALPGALAVGRRSDARVSLVDLGATLTLLLGLPVPARTPMDGRGPLLWNALRGGGGDPGVFIQGERDEWRRGDRRVLFDAARGTARTETRGPGGNWKALDADQATATLAEARAASDALQPLLERPTTARVPAGDWPAGW